MRLKNFIIKGYFSLPFWNYLTSALLFWLPKHSTYQIKFSRQYQHENICVFAHFDPDNEIKAYVIDYLKVLKANNFDIIFVSTSTLNNWDSIKDYCQQIVLRENIGHDFGSYKLGIHLIDTTINYQQLLLANDSVYGPITPLQPIFKHMQSQECWGLTYSYEFSPHVQSYFLVIAPSIWKSATFNRFWKRVRLLPWRRLLIVTYEIGFTQYMLNAGVTPVSFINSSIAGNNQNNICHSYWQELLMKHQFPFIKLNILAYKYAPDKVTFKKILEKILPTDKLHDVINLCQQKAERLK